ncbi:MAG: enoyl-CoA hydratase/isomerase family protein [Pseudomonadales bacterium]|nr:enoyl-CoA hydratase/isomerase family protein [Pseudomonadales bacterium]
MTEPKLLFEVDSRGVATLTLNRPEVHNAFDDEVIGALIARLEEVESNSNIRALVLRSNGKHFSAGADLGWMKRMADLTYDQNLADAGELATLMSRLDALRVPVLTLVQGAAYAGALGLVCCSDVTLASTRATFCISEVNLGLAPAVISPYVVAVMGARAARRYFLSAEVFDADEAQRLGIVTEIVDEFELDSACERVITNWLAKGPVALARTKALIRRVARAPVDDAMIESTIALIAELRVSAEGQEGLAAFFEKRNPSWRE